ncbi:MAG TPA: hypothetical protein VFQ53_12850 [Kofleriaceae bacterium]|nr:hypothetical protein [Kofleriaceae bacterium]
MFRLAPQVLAVVAVSALGGCIMPYAIPPTRGEIGAATTTGDHAPAAHVAGGAHFASGTTGSQPTFDLGIGGFFDWNEQGTAARGVYTDAAVFVERHDSTRTSIGLRTELHLPVEMSGPGFGAKLRIDHEMFGSTSKGYSGSDRCGFIAGAAHGTAAVGFYAEAGPVRLPTTETAWTASAGLTLRLPSTMGIVFGIPGCH